VGGDGDQVHVHNEDAEARAGMNITQGRKRQTGRRTACDTRAATRNLVLGVGKDVAGVDSSLADEQGRMVGADNGKNGKEADNTGNLQRTEGRVPSPWGHKDGRTSHHQSGADVEVETGNTGDGPRHGSTGRR
jgi:hypothetical protein